MSPRGQHLTIDSTSDHGPEVQAVGRDQERNHKADQRIDAIETVSVEQRNIYSSSPDDEAGSSSSLCMSSKGARVDACLAKDASLSAHVDRSTIPIIPHFAQES